MIGILIGDLSLKVFSVDKLSPAVCYFQISIHYYITESYLVNTEISFSCYLVIMKKFVITKYQQLIIDWTWKLNELDDIYQFRIFVTEIIFIGHDKNNENNRRKQRN